MELNLIEINFTERRQSIGSIAVLYHIESEHRPTTNMNHEQQRYAALIIVDHALEMIELSCL